LRDYRLRPVEIMHMQELVERIHQFQNDVFSSKQRLFEGLVDD
jgi:hypothetical protein